MRWFLVALMMTMIGAREIGKPVAKNIYNQIDDVTTTIIEPPMELKVVGAPAQLKSLSFWAEAKRAQDHQNEPASHVTLVFRSTGELSYSEKGAAGELSLDLIADGKRGAMGLAYRASTDGRSEEMSGSISLESLTQLSRARKVRMQIETTQFDLTPDHLNALRQFVALAKVKAPRR